MYCSNDNYDADPAAERGDGKYRPVLARGDGHMHFLITRSLVFDGDLHLDDDLAAFGDPWNQPRTVTGRKNVMQQIGPSLAWAPLLAAARGAAAVANVFGAGIATHGYTLFHQRILFASSVVFAWLAIALGALVARRLVGGRWAPAIAATAALLGTTLTYYATYMPSYAHAMDAAVCAGFLALWALTLGELRWRRYVGLGALLGAAAMVRAQDVLLGAVLVLELVPLAWRHGRARGAAAGAAVIARGALVLAIAAVMFVPQLYVWNQMYGAWLTTPQGPGQMRYGHPMVLELLFASRNGWLSTHPIAYLGMIGLGAGVVAGRRLGPHVRLVCGGLVLAVAGQVYINAVTYEWWSGASFGQRRMASVTLAVVVGLAVLLVAVHRLVRARLGRRAQLAVAFAVLGYLVAWNQVWVHRLRAGAPAGRDNQPMCCADVPRPLRWIARPVYRAIGNPFALPASAWFALRHGTELRRWDRAVGMYALVPPVLGYIDGSYRRATARWDWVGPGGEPYILGGLGPPQALDRPRRTFRWTTAPRAELLVPLLAPEPHRLTLSIAANAAPGETIDVRVLANGSEVARAAVGPEWTTLAFETDGSVGHNEIAIEARVAPYVAGSAVPPPANPVPIGVALGVLHVALPPR